MNRLNRNPSTATDDLLRSVGAPGQLNDGGRESTARLNPPVSKVASFELDEQGVTDLVTWARRVQGVARAEKTLKTYSRQFARLQKQNDAVGQSANRNSRAVKRATLRFVVSRGVLSAIANGDRKSLLLYAEMKRNIDLAADQGLEDAPPGGSDNKIRRRSKKVSLVGLPKDWRIIFLDRAGNGQKGRPSQYYAAMSVMAACGCRPSELELGVLVSVDGRGENLIFSIQGAKVTDKNGQRWREVTVSLDSPLSSRAVLGLVQAPAKALNDAVVRIGKKVFPNRGPIWQISPYSFRHAIAGDFKFSGSSEAEVSAALGHRSTLTKAFYGPRRGPGGQRLVAVECSDKVREHAVSELPSSLIKYRKDAEK